MDGPTNPPSLQDDFVYVVLIFALFVVPRLLQRWRVPTAITNLALGAVAGRCGFGLFENDRTVTLLSTLGISSLFLFAGLDVQLGELRTHKRVLFQHLAIRFALLAAAAWGLVAAAGLGLREGTLVALALLTPSTGFILDSLDGLGVGAKDRFWIRAMAIVTEMTALAVLFVAVQSTTALRMGVATGVLVLLVFLVPVLFRMFAAVLAPHAPKSEFAFLVMLAVTCALVTHELGVYYLVGAFVVGMSAQRLRDKMPAMTSERVLHALEAFASLFVPFYFFHAGLGLRREDFGLLPLGVGLGFLAVVVPVRIGVVALHRRLALGETLKETLRVSLPLQPTLVFTLVLAEIIRSRFESPPWLFGALVVYAIGTTLLPTLLFRAPPPDFDAPSAPPLRESAASPERRAPEAGEAPPPPVSS
jgi:Kef-type K+ transport system membrane component KefB